MPHPKGEPNYYFSGTNNAFAALSIGENDDSSSQKTSIPSQKAHSDFGSRSNAQSTISVASKKPTKTVQGGLKNSHIPQTPIRNNNYNHHGQLQPTTRGGSQGSSYGKIKPYAKPYNGNSKSQYQRVEAPIRRVRVADGHPGLLLYKTDPSQPPGGTYPFHLPPLSSKPGRGTSHRSALASDELFQLSHVADESGAFIKLAKLERTHHDYIQHLDLYGSEKAVSVAIDSLQKVAPIPTRQSGSKFPKNYAFKPEEEEKALRREEKEEIERGYLSQDLTAIELDTIPHQTLVKYDHTQSMYKVFGPNLEALNKIRKTFRTYIIPSAGALLFASRYPGVIQLAINEYQSLIEAAATLDRAVSTNTLWHGFANLKDLPVYLVDVKIPGSTTSLKTASVPRMKHLYEYEIDGAALEELQGKLKDALHSSQILPGALDLRISLGTPILDRYLQGCSKLSGEDFMDMVDESGDFSFVGISKDLSDNLHNRILAAQHLLGPADAQIQSLEAVPCMYMGEFYLNNMDKGSFCATITYNDYLEECEVLWRQCESHRDLGTTLLDLTLASPHEQSLATNFRLNRHHVNVKKPENIGVPPAWVKIASTIRMVDSFGPDTTRFMTIPAKTTWPLQKARLSRGHDYNIRATGYRLRSLKHVDFNQNDTREAQSLHVVHEQWGAMLANNEKKKRVKRPALEPEEVLETYFPAFTTDASRGPEYNSNGLLQLLNIVADVQNVITGHSVAPPKPQKGRKGNQAVHVELEIPEEHSESESD